MVKARKVVVNFMILLIIEIHLALPVFDCTSILDSVISDPCEALSQETDLSAFAEPNRLRDPSDSSGARVFPFFN